jgi:hypothetical protein
LDGYIEVRDVAEAAITEMDHLAVNLREVSTQHAVHVAKAVAGRYVHMSIMARACGVDNPHLYNILYIFSY